MTRQIKHAGLACLLALSFALGLRARADNARFDLAGPKVDVRVTRGGTTLPIAQVPNLQPGDKIWVKADLPSTQSNHLLLVVAFLRGTTNEPPDDWFTVIDTWDKKTKEGTLITVPKEAQQAIMFIAPETGGDFKTLRGAVKGRPGLFIRADADLNEASFEQQRIDRYLAAMKNVPATDSKAIADHSAKLASTLALKPNPDCFKKPVDQQVDCLTQTAPPVLLNDGHAQSVADAVATGPSSDFINQASWTQAAGAGVYSAYVGAIVDAVHLISLLKTAQYQYIPSLLFPEGATLNLKLNTPPSFINPKTVIVIGLPAIQPAKLPPLKPHDPNEVACLLQPKMTLPIEGAPLVFATNFAHDIVLHLNRTGPATDLPLRPDAFEGGLIVSKQQDRKELQITNAEQKADTPKTGAKLGGTNDLEITGTIRGYWGFNSFEGPTVTLQQVDGKDWKVVGDTQLMAGKDNKLVLGGEGTACVQKIALTDNSKKDVDVSFKPATTDGKDGKVEKNKLALDVSLKTVEPGGYSLGVQQYGGSAPDRVPLTAYNADIHIDSVKVHAGDDAALLTGAGLKNVVSVEIAKQEFTPAGDGNNDNNLHMHAKAAVTPNEGDEAVVKLKDGRTMKVKIAAEAARPMLQLVSMKATAAQQPGGIAVKLGAPDDISLNGRLTFVVTTKADFPRTQSVEVATADGSSHTTLSLANNDLVLQDAHTAVATLDPLKAFGQSAFGVLAMRPVAADGTPGDWTRLGKLVRTPQITAIKCSTPDAPTCEVDGSNFFLVQSFGAAKDFAKPTDVPTGFADSSFAVPTPQDGATLYLKLRDDPSALATVVLPTPMQKAAAPAPVAKAAAASAPVVAAVPTAAKVATPQP